MKLLAAFLLATASLHAQAIDYAARAEEVTAYCRKNFWIKQTELYAGDSAKPDKPDFIWGGGVMFSPSSAPAPTTSAGRGP